MKLSTTKPTPSSRIEMFSVDHYWTLSNPLHKALIKKVKTTSLTKTQFIDQNADKSINKQIEYVEYFNSFFLFSFSSRTKQNGYLFTH